MSRSFTLIVCGCPRSVAAVCGNEKCIRRSLLSSVYNRKTIITAVNCIEVEHEHRCPDGDVYSSDALPHSADSPMARRPVIESMWMRKKSGVCLLYTSPSP